MSNQFKCLPFCNKINNFSFDKRYNFFNETKYVFLLRLELAQCVNIWQIECVWLFQKKYGIAPNNNFLFQNLFVFLDCPQRPQVLLESPLSLLPHVVYFDQKMGASHAVCCVKSFLGHFNTFFITNRKKKKKCKNLEKYFLCCKEIALQLNHGGLRTV